MTRHAILLAALLLAACGSGGGGGNDTAGNDSADEGPAAAVIEQTPANLYDDQTNSVVPIDPPANAAAAGPSPVAAIPSAFRGRWGMVPNDCDPKQDFAAKGLMTVTADRLAFYESRAVPANIRLGSPTTLTADLAFSGEGQTWRQTATLTLADGGKTLIREAVGGEKGDETGAQRYGKCPGAPA